ncbi:MAG: DNA mismatch repair endonuclease MutL [Armatimonadota bacterium]
MGIPVAEDAEADVDSVVRLLDDNTANRIAAGEVVERPSSVVKELVENSLDAGAMRVEVELVDGGRTRIVVRDDGEGMSRTDAIVALQRHATSKIRTADDLFAITTLGFRGEALPSIASVSDFALVTKRRGDAVATRLVVRGGELVRVEDAASPDGTLVEVDDLFHSVPARRKFLKTIATERNHAVDFVQRMVLARPEVAFRLDHDGETVLEHGGSSDPRHALASVLGRDVAREMVPLAAEGPGLRVHGHVSKPSVTRASRSGQYFYVNGRPVRSRTVQHAFESAYRRLVDADRHPVCVLFVDIAPDMVDVNVHPAKTEVRFHRDGDIYAMVARAVEGALLSGGLVPEVRVVASTPAASQGPAPATSGRIALPHKPALSNYVRLGEAGGALPETGLFQPVERADPGGATAPQGEAEPFLGFDGYRIGRLRVIGQSRNTYIVAETDDAVLLIDQHVAHERVLYEQMMNGVEEGRDRWGVIAQRLALPATLELGLPEARVVGERIDALARAGFDLEPFGEGAFLVRAVPAVIASKPYIEILRTIVDDLVHASAVRRLLVPHESAVIHASCRLAVKKGDPLTLDEMTRLLADLSTMRNAFTCPHGRPILLALPHREMDRKFHRIGPH